MVRKRTINATKVEIIKVALNLIKDEEVLYTQTSDETGVVIFDVEDGVYS